jgi:hypothetical protein
VSPDRCTESLMLANGFSVDMLLELVREGLASAEPERLWSLAASRSRLRGCASPRRGGRRSTGRGYDRQEARVPEINMAASTVAKLEAESPACTTLSFNSKGSLKSQGREALRELQATENPDSNLLTAGTPPCAAPSSASATRPTHWPLRLHSARRPRPSLPRRKDS